MTTTDKPLFLVGFMATGKSTVGRLVAARTGWQFIDLDEAIVATASKTVSEIFAAEGEAGFRRYEAEAVLEACGRARAVIATGGGAACREVNLRAMLEAGHVVALSATPAEVLRRSGSASGRPLLDVSGDRVAAAAKLLAAREPFYARAHHTVDTVGKTPSQVAAEVLSKLNVT